MSSIIQRIRSAMWIDAAGIGTCLAATVLAYYVGISPLFEQRHLAKLEQQQLADKQSQAAAIEGSIRELKTQLRTVQEELAGTNMNLVPADMVNSRVAELTALLTGCSLAVDDINIGEATKGLHCQTVPIQIAGRGGYVHCTQFLHSLSNRLPDIHVATVSLNRSPTGQQEQHTFKLDLVWYTSSS